MMIAQRLYEGVELGEEGSVGLITYMRTDSTRVSPDALAEVREYIGNGIRQRLPAGDSPTLTKRRRRRRKRTKPSAQRRSCGIPTRSSSILKEDEFKVYKLIWQRFVASQIKPAVFDQTTVDIDAKSRKRNVTGSA